MREGGKSFPETPVGACWRQGVARPARATHLEGSASQHHVCLSRMRGSARSTAHAREGGGGVGAAEEGGILFPRPWHGWRRARGAQERPGPGVRLLKCALACGSASDATPTPFGALDAHMPPRCRGGVTSLQGGREIARWNRAAFRGARASHPSELLLPFRATRGQVLPSCRLYASARRPFPPLLDTLHRPRHCHVPQEGPLACHHAER